MTKTTDDKEEQKFYDEINSEFKRQITDIKPSAAFASETKRFEQKLDQTEDKKPVPGPGNYNIPSFTEQLERKMAYKQHILAAKEEKQRQTDNIKAIHRERMGVPSIPGNEHKLGYTFTDGSRR